MDAPTEAPIRILLLEDEPADAELVQRALRKAGIAFSAVRADSEAQLTRGMEVFRPDIILADYKLPAFDGGAALRIVRERHPEIPVIMVTGALGDESAAELIRAGACDYVLKDRLARLGTAVRQTLADNAQRLQHQATEQALRRSEELLRSFVEHAPAPIAMFDRDMRYLAVSRRFLVDYRLGQQDIVGRSHYEVFPEIPERWKEIHRRCLAGAIEQSDEDSFQRADGTLDWLRWEIRPWFEADHSIGGIILFSELITERRRAEHRLRLMAYLGESSPAVLFRWRSEPGWPVDFVSANLSMWGYDAARWIADATPYASIVHPDDLERVGREVAAFEASRADRFSQEYRILTASGDVRWLDGRTVVEREADGRVRYYQGIVVDVTERKRAEQALHERTQRLAAQVRALDAISASMALEDGDVGRLAHEITEQAGLATGVERASVWLFDDAETELHCVDLYERTPARHSAGMLLREEQYRDEFRALKAAPYVDAGEPLTDPRTRGYTETYLKPLRITAMLDALVEVADRHLGLLCLEHVDRAHHWEQDEIEFACRLADKIGLAIGRRDARQMQEQLRASLEQAVRAIANTVEVRDPYTAGHQRRVAALAAAIARELGLSAERVHAVDLAGAIHDVGKFQVPADILTRPGRLSPIEHQLVQLHAQAGYDIVKDVPFPWPIAEMIRQHHERLDGSGYPRGLRGEQILLEARVLAVADAVEAMASHRPYRAGLGVEAALDEIVKGRGVLYDADVVDACVRLFREAGYRLPSVWPPGAAAADDGAPATAAGPR
ncbi:MAG: HD domain-containing phosphohydrolase [Pseudomonadota bacterium]